MKNTRGRPKGSGKYTKSYRIRLSEEQLNKLKLVSEATGLDISVILRDLIDKHLEEDKK